MYRKAARRWGGGWAITMETAPDLLARFSPEGQEAQSTYVVRVVTLVPALLSWP
jgi:hypothetical protein